MNGRETKVLATDGCGQLQDKGIKTNLAADKDLMKVERQKESLFLILTKRKALRLKSFSRRAREERKEGQNKKQDFMV